MTGFELTRQQLNEIIYLLADLYPEQNAAREYWVRAGGKAGWFHHDPQGVTMWSLNIRETKNGARPALVNLLKQALKENPIDAAPLQEYLEQLETK